MIIANEHLQEILQFLGIGFAIGVGGGAFAFLLGSIVNGFYSIIDKADNS